MAGDRPVDLQLVVIPTDVRHIAIREARAGAERDVIHVEVLAGLLEVAKLVNEPLKERDALDARLLKVVGGLVLVLLIGFNSVAHPDGVAAVLRVAVIVRDFLVQVSEFPAL